MNRYRSAHELTATLEAMAQHERERQTMLQDAGGMGRRP